MAAVAGRLYAIADADALGSRPLVPAVLAMAEAGVSWIQVRAKRASGGELFAALAGCLDGLAGWNGELWIDDRVDLALLLPLAGVHLGQHDLPATAARRLLAPGQRIGGSTHHDAELAAAIADPAVDVVAVGPIYPTGSKERSDPVVGLEFLRAARRQTEKTLVAIGGIDAERLPAVLAAGADAAAVIAAICHGDVAANARRLLAAAA